MASQARYVVEHASSVDETRRFFGISDARAKELEALVADVVSSRKSGLRSAARKPAIKKRDAAAKKATAPAKGEKVTPKATSTKTGRGKPVGKAGKRQPARA